MATTSQSGSAPSELLDTHPGALVRITPETVLRATGLIRIGQVLDLGSVLSKDMPFGNGNLFLGPYRLTRYRRSADLVRGIDLAGTSFSTEIVTGALHAGTHLDAFCHVQFEGRVYGGATAEEAEGDFGWQAMGMETVAPIVTRGVFLDIAGDRGVQWLPDGEEITLDEVQAAVARRGVTIASGDAVLIRTGKMRQYDDPAAFEAGQPGLGVDAAIWLYEQGMAVLAADNTSVEPQPVVNWARNLHVEMLYRRGVHLLEWIDLEPLRAAEVVTCCFICSPMKLQGATGSWVRPIAIL